jgi:hypothetical protein
LALEGEKWLASSPGGFTTGETPPCSYWIGNRIDPRAGLYAVQKKKYGMAQKWVNWVVRCILKYVTNFYITY